MDNFLYHHGTNAAIFKNLAATADTANPVDYAWGGYMDAGDWDRRAYHLFPTMQHLELFELFPEYFKDYALGVPEEEATNNIPDIIDEALFNIDCYRRMQQPDGGIPHGIESAEHPVQGEVSWQESLPVYMFAPDCWSSFAYAHTAAYAGYLLKDIDAEKSKMYLESALKATKWAEKDYQRVIKIPEYYTMQDYRRALVESARSQAFVHLYRATEDNQWLKMFDTYKFNQSDTIQHTGVDGFVDAAFTYTNLPAHLGKKKDKEFYKKQLIAIGNTILKMGEGNSYNIVNRHPKSTMVNGYYTGINNQDLCRAYLLTNDQKYLNYDQSFLILTDDEALNESIISESGERLHHKKTFLINANSDQVYPYKRLYQIEQEGSFSSIFSQL